MGQAKAKASARPELTEAARAAMLGNDPFTTAYDFMFEAVSKMFLISGNIKPELVGLDFQDGQIKGVNVIPIRRREDVTELRAQMLLRWPMVIDLFEGWRAPPGGTLPPSQHPERIESIFLLLNTTNIAAAAFCDIDQKTRSLTRTELIYPDRIEGNFKRDLPPQGTQH